MYFKSKKIGIGNRFFKLLICISVFIASLGIQTVNSNAGFNYDWLEVEKYFAKGGNKVYFRKFGKEDTIREHQLYGYYYDFPTGKKGGYVAVYDKKTKKVSKAFHDNGDFLHYLNKRFYIQKAGEAYSVDKNGKNYKPLSSHGYIMGLFKKGYVAVKEYGSKRNILIFKNAKKVCELKNAYSVLMEGDYVVYTEMDGGDYSRYVKVWCKDLKTKKKSILMGTIELDSLEEGIDNHEPFQIKMRNSKIYFSMVFCTGSGNYLQAACVYKVDPKRKNSLKLVTKNLLEEDSDGIAIKRFEVDKKGNVKTFFEEVGDYISHI